ncbi:Golgi membrane exchange factor (Ric1p-Rgp1p) subunit, partial [Kickxella alabastrina]
SSVQSGRDAGLTIQTTNIRHQSRPSTSSVLSTPTTTMSSWLPFGPKPQQQQQQQLGVFSSRKPTCSTPNEGPPSETGSSGLLSSLWRNLAGGSNPPSRKGTRAGTLSEEDFGIERLAIGFVEASGSLALSTAYIKPDQLDLLMTHRGTDSTLGKGKRDPPIGGGLGGWAPANGAGHSSSRTQKSLPILISSPTVLFSELALAPGDSQTYSLKVQLPESLPPSFRGRAACITYDLVIVAKRSMLESSSYVARIPFRVLAHVRTSGSATTFSFERPIHMPPNSSRLTFQESTSVMTPRNASPSFIASADMSRASSASMGSPGGAGTHRLLSGGLDRIYEQLAGSEFLRSLLQGIDSDMLADTRSVPSIELGANAERAAVGAEASKANIQAICGRRAPVSFSLSQDERALASVWLPKRAYQLGDMVSGKVNLYSGSINVYHISIWLESVEAIGGQFASYEPGQTEALTRKIFAEHHGFCRGNSTLGFSLATSPSSASSFASAIVSNVWQLRIELIISAPGTPACDLVLSEVTPFPPAQSQLTSPSPYISRALSPPRRFLGQRIGRHQEGDDALAAPMQSPPPVMPMFAAAALHGSARAGRLRSSTMAGGSGSGSSLHQPHPPIVVSSPITETADLSRADRQQLPAALSPPRLRKSINHNARATRRRYDLAREVQVQTLSCTVAIQMHPSLIRTHLDGQKDTYTIDLTKRSN